MRVVLSDLLPGTKYAAQFRAYNGDGYSDWSQVMYFDTTGDTLAPAQVQNLSWTVTGGTFTATWDKVVFNSDGTVLNDFHDYEITISDGDANTAAVFHTSSESYAFPLDLNQSTFGRIQTTLTITVQARDFTGNRSEPTSATCTDPLPPKPTTPKVGNYLGQLVVEWDGQGANGYAMPYNFHHLDVHLSKDPNFIPSDDTLNQRFYAAAKIIISDLEYDTTYYVRFVAVNSLGQTSDPSDVGSGKPSRISGLDIQGGAISVDQINFQDQIGGPRAFYQTTKPTAGMKEKDIWYDKSDQYQAYVYNGTDWIKNDDIGTISGRKILAGTVTADQVGANKIITSSANIGLAVIDAANIGSVNAGTITAGQLKSGFTVNVDGITRPAWMLDTAGNASLASASIVGTVTIGTTTNTDANNALIALQSANYLKGSKGYAITGDGSVEFNNGIFRGTLNGNSIIGASMTGGTISGTTITGVDISASSTIRGATITGGTFQTSASNTNTVRLDTTGLRLYNSAGTAIVNMPTTGGAVITGLFKSNYSGMRVEIDGGYTRQNASNPWTVYAGIRMFTGSDAMWGEIGTGQDPTSGGYTTQVISPGADANNGSFLRLRNNNTFQLYGNGVGEVSSTVGLNLIGNQNGGTGNLTATGYATTVAASNGQLSLNSFLNTVINSTSHVVINANGGNANLNGTIVNLNGNAVNLNCYGGAIAVGQLATGTGTIGIRFGNQVGINSVGNVFAIRNSNDSDVAPISCGYVYNTGGVAVASDIKLKSNIASVTTTSMLDELMATQVYEYDMNAGGVDNRTRGLMAHEVPELLLAPVSAAVDHKSIDLYALVATSVGAIQELHATIEGLRQEINNLKGNNNG